ncbi:MAG: Gfo/Idh/MocA family oxidoreductase [Chloroflexi bacterium]|jgi:UDP-N-acetylglucosamine 3-dehydrogenase|nr:Gfo/Idh/MocA family oxidoreductase [Chloroflexota bacterium]
MAEKRLRMGIAGMVNDHVWFMADATHALPNAELVSVAEPHPELGQQAVERYGLASSYTSYEEMLDNEQLDAVMICSDNADKVKIVTAAARRGIHCYVDKPMSARYAQASEMVAVARKAGIKMMVAYHFFFNSTYNKVKGWIAEGRIGQVYLARASIGHAGPREINLSKYFCEWLEDKERAGGGAWVDEAGYMISAMVDNLGPVTDVSAFMNQQGWRDYLAPDIEDNSAAILKFESGALGVIDSRWGQIGRVPFEQSYHGTDGTIMQGWDAVRVFSRRSLPADMQGWLEVPIMRDPRGSGEAAHFVDTVLAGGDFEGVISPEGACHVQAVIEAGYLSAEQGRAITLPLD